MGLDMPKLYRKMHLYIKIVNVCSPYQLRGQQLWFELKPGYTTRVGHVISGSNQGAGRVNVGLPSQYRILVSTFTIDTAAS